VKLFVVARTVARFSDLDVSGALLTPNETAIATKLRPGVIDRTCWAHFEKRL
jgi:hypothetical protein